MFFVLSKILGFLTQPFIWVVILLIASWMIKRARIKKFLRISALVVFALFSNSFIVSEVMKAWEGNNKTVLKDKYEAVIVLGGYSGWNTRHQIHEVSESADRVLQAVKFYKKSIAEKILLSGGSGLILKPEEKESELVKVSLIELGINEMDILVEGNSRNTFENATFTSQLITEKWDSSARFLLITSAFHMKRAEACFAKTDIQFDTYRVDFHIDDDDYDVETFIVPSLSAFMTWQLLIKEWIGISVYWFRNYL